MPPKISPSSRNQPQQPRGNPSTQWRSICLQPPPPTSSSSATNKTTKINSNNNNTIIIRHANWIHATRPILLTIDSESGVWIVDLDQKSAMEGMIQRKLIVPQTAQQQHQNKQSDKERFLKDAEVTAAASILPSHVNYTRVSNQIAESLCKIETTRDSSDMTGTITTTVPFAAFATRGGKLRLVLHQQIRNEIGAIAGSDIIMSSSKIVSTTTTSDNHNSNDSHLTEGLEWNCGCDNISEIQLSSDLNGDNNDTFSSSSLSVALIGYSKEEESLFVCYTKYSPSLISSTIIKASTIVKKVRGSSRLLFGSALTSFNFFATTTCLVARGREVDALQLLPEISFDVENDGGSFELPFLFFPEKIASLQQLGPFALQKKSHQLPLRNQRSSSSRDDNDDGGVIENEPAFLVTRCGTARILMRQKIAQLMGIFGSSDDDAQHQQSKSESQSGNKAKSPFLFDSDNEDEDVENKNIFESDRHLQDEKVIQEWFHQQQKSKQTRNNNSNKDSSTKNQDEHVFDKDAATNSSSSPSSIINKLSSVCTCEVPGGDGYIESTSVSPTGSVVAFGFESGVIVVGFVAARPSPMKLKFDQQSSQQQQQQNQNQKQHQQQSTSSSSNSSSSFFITSCPQLMFITKIMSRIPRMSPAQLIIDERRASVLSLDNSGVLELLIFPSAIRRPTNTTPVITTTNTTTNTTALTSGISPSTTSAAAAASSSSTSLSLSGAMISASSGDTASNMSTSLPHSICSSVARLAAAQRAAPLDTAAQNALLQQSNNPVGNKNSNATKSSASATSTSTTNAATVSSPLSLFPLLLAPMKSNSGVVGGEHAVTSSSAPLAVKSNRKCTKKNSASSSSLPSLRSLHLIAELEKIKLLIFNEFAGQDEEKFKRICAQLFSKTTLAFMTAGNGNLKSSFLSFSFLPSRNTAHTSSAESYFIDGHFDPVFNPFTALTLRDETMFSGGRNMDGKNSQQINTANSFLLMNVIEAARVRAFVASAPSLGPSTRATKFRLWKQLVGQKVKNLFQQQQQQQQPSSPSSKSKKKQIEAKSLKVGDKKELKKPNGTQKLQTNQPQQQQKQKQKTQQQLLPWSPSRSNRKREIKKSNDDDDDDESLGTSSDDDDDNEIDGNGGGEYFSSRLAGDGVAFFDRLHQLQEDLVLSRFLIDDEATSQYCSTFMVAP